MVMTNLALILPGSSIPAFLRCHRPRASFCSAAENTLRNGTPYSGRIERRPPSFRCERLSEVSEVSSVVSLCLWWMLISPAPSETLLFVAAE